MIPVSLLAVLLLAKGAILAGRTISWSAWTVIAYVWQDVLLVLAFAAIAWASRSRPARCSFLKYGPDIPSRRAWPSGRLVGLGARRPFHHGLSGLVWTMYWVVAGYTAMNIPIALVLSTPLTWPMVRATSGTLADSILLYATPLNVFLVLLALLMAALLPHLLRRMSSGAWVSALAAAAGLSVIALGPAATARVDTMGLHRNAVIALALSALPRISAEATAGEWTAPLERRETDDLSHLRGVAAGRHVILVSLESTGAQYLRLYGGSHDITPHLDRLAQQAVVFEAAYAVYPESIKGLFSVMCSTYPAFDTGVERYEAAPCRSIAQLLGERGYRTALFHSGRFGYLGMNSIIRARGFDVLEDAGDIGGNHQSSFGVDEPATVTRILSWIDSLQKGQRFFVSYLPIAGHHPYETPDAGPFPGHEEIDRYRNALHYGDRALGALADGLRARGLDDDTVWIVLGDHGEALGQHQGNYGHTFFLYEENVRVPFLVVVPEALPRQLRSRTTVSLVDTAPTILDALGLPIPPEHQGRSALDGRARMALFYTDYSLSLVGLRDGPWKFIHELDSRRSKLFDLSSDAAERIDASGMHPARVAAYERTLRGWSASQKSYLAASSTR